MAHTKLTAEDLRQRLSYDPETGQFTRLIAVRAGRWKVGDVAGSANKAIGYVVLNIDGKYVYGHRLAVLYMTGKWPECEVDHINGDRSDNRWANLRCVTRQMNAENMRSANAWNTHGFMGVERTKGATRSRPWAARIKVKGKRIHLGMYATPEEASAAYISAKRMLHAGCTI